MADLTATQKIEVQALWDGTQLKRGSEEAERSIEDLARVFDTETDQIRRSLDDMDRATQDTLGSGGSLDRAAPDLQAQGTRTAAIGSEIGQEFGQNMSEGFSSGDITGSVLDTFAALSGAAGVAGIGILVGATLVKGMITGAKEKTQEFYDEFNSVFGSLEIDAKTTAKQITNQFRKEIDINAVIEKLGGDQGLKGGMEKVNEIIDESGLKFDAIVDVLRGKVNPESRKAKDVLAELSKQTEGSVRGMGDYATATSEAAKLAEDILGYSEDNQQFLRDSKEYGSQIAGYMQHTGDYTRASADAMERYAAAAAAARDAINTTRPLPSLTEVRGG